MKHTYLVCIEVDDKLPKEVVDNYIGRALRDHAVLDDQKAFDGVSLPKTILSLPVTGPVEDFATIGETFELLKQVNNYFLVMQKIKGIKK